MKIREKQSSGIELSTNCVQLKLIAEDNKERETDCADTEGIFRIIQSIPSKKAEPFKRWVVVFSSLPPYIPFIALITRKLASIPVILHVHYSIDVFAAFFITYGVYIIGNKIFGKGLHN
jgi:hypothetical protein